MPISPWIMFDDRGVAHVGAVPNLLPGIKLQLSAADYFDYLIANAGFVAVRKVRSGVLIRLRAAIVSQVALAASIYWLADLGEVRVAANILGSTGWQDEFVGLTGVQIGRRLHTLIAKHSNRTQQSIVRRKVSIAQLPVDHPFRATAKLVSDQSVTFGELNEELLRCVDGRYAWIAVDEDCGQLILSEIGPGWPEKIRIVLAHGVNQPLREQVDSEYGEYCHNAYSSVAAIGELSIEDVDAEIPIPGGHKLRRTYKRAIFPVMRPNKSMRLLCASCEEPSLDLRFATH